MYLSLVSFLSFDTNCIIFQSYLYASHSAVSIQLLAAIMSACLHINMSACQYVSMSACQHVIMSSCQYVSMSPCHHVSMSSCQ